MIAKSTKQKRRKQAIDRAAIAAALISAVDVDCDVPWDDVAFVADYVSRFPRGSLERDVAAIQCAGRPDMVQAMGYRTPSCVLTESELL